MTTPTILKPFSLSALYISLRGATLLLPWALHLFISDILLSVLLLPSFVFPRPCYDVASSIASPVWRGIQIIFEKFNRARITVSGDPLPKNESAVVIANHVSWTDFYLIQHLAINSGMLGRCRYFAKQQLKWVPFLGWGLWAMGMPLISRKWNRDQRELDRVFKGPKSGWPICKFPLSRNLPWLTEDSTGLISYSEATRFTPQKYLETVQWCKANNKPVPKFTLYPRTKGFVTTVKELRKGSSVKAIYDLTIAYAHGKQFFEAPSMWETLAEPRLDKGWRFHVHVNRYDIAEMVGLSDTELSEWLEKRWIEKGKKLENLSQDLLSGDTWFDSQKDK